MNESRIPSRIFLVSGIYGLLVMLPQFFMEASVGRDYPPAITHPEFYYGFVGVTTVWQLLLLVIARNPRRYRPLMILCILEKLSFTIAVGILGWLDRVAPVVLLFGGIDFVIAVAIAVAYRLTPAESASPGTAAL